MVSSPVRPGGGASEQWGREMSQPREGEEGQREGGRKGRREGSQFHASAL